MTHPTDWSKSELGNLVLEDAPICYGVLKPGDFQYDGVPLIRIVDLDSNRVHEAELFQISKKLDSEFKRSRLKGGELLISIQGTVGRVAVAPAWTKGANISRTIARVSVDRAKADELYLRQWLLSKDGGRAIRDAISGTTRDSLNLSALRKIEVPHPRELAEQSKIAEILTKVDSAIEQTEALIAKQQRIKTGLMQDLLTKGIDEHGNIRSEATHAFKDSPLGRIPVEWEVLTLEQLGDIVTGSTPDTTNQSFYDGDVMFVSPKDITDVSDFILETEKTLTINGLGVCRVIPQNSICVVCIGSTIGKIGLTVERCATNQQINTLIPHEAHDTEIIFFSMKLFLQPQLRREAGLQAVPIVNKKTFSTLRLPFPKDSKEKDSIRDTLTASSQQLIATTRHLGKLYLLKFGLMHDLLTGEHRVTTLLTQAVQQ